MAHWIIEDKGFGGTVYQCSECKDIWNDLFHKDISSITEHCPGCGVLLNEDEIEYIDHKRERKGKTMKQYILFDEEELEALKNGEEIKHHISGVGELYFMSKEAFRNPPLKKKINRTLTIEYETFPEVNMSALTVVDPETDIAIFMVNDEEADELYKRFTQYE